MLVFHGIHHLKSAPGISADTAERDRLSVSPAPKGEAEPSQSQGFSFNRRFWDNVFFFFWGSSFLSSALSKQKKIPEA